MTSHRGAFPFIATCFTKCVRIYQTWTSNHLIICKYNKQNPIFKDGSTHRACSVEFQFEQPNEKNTQGPNLDKLDVERMTDIRVSARGGGDPGPHSAPKGGYPPLVGKKIKIFSM